MSEPIAPDMMKRHLDGIKSMTATQVCALWRFARIGHPYFNSVDVNLRPLFQAVEAQMAATGGMTPSISKDIDSMADYWRRRVNRIDVDTPFQQDRVEAQ